MKEGVRQVMGARGLLMREHEDAGKGVLELLGHTIKAMEGTISISPKRAWRLRDAMLHASRLRSLSGIALEVILGHAGFCFFWCDVVCCQCLAWRMPLSKRITARQLHCCRQCDGNSGMLHFSCCQRFPTCEDHGVRPCGVLMLRHTGLPRLRPLGR